MTTEEERAAWDQYAAEMLPTFDADRPELAAKRAAEAADALLAERKKRFQE